MEITKAINSTQIAKLAGVSRSTVSKVINNYPDIPEETKQKVRSVIEKHRYTPNASAQVLKGKAQCVVALYVYASEVDVNKDALSSIGSPYVMGVIANFINAAKQYNHRMMVEMLRHGDDELETLHRIRGHFESKSITAAVFLGLTKSSTFIDQLVADNLPVAVIDRDVDDNRRAINIYTDDALGTFNATSHLINEGYRCILFLGGDQDKRSAKMRSSGYKQAMKQHGLTPEILEGEYSEQAGARAVDHILKMQPRPDAVVCSCDAVAYGLIKKLNETDQNYLNQLALTGFDDTDFNDFLSPPLSSVRVDFAAMASNTITALLDPEHYQPEPVPVELVVRSSSLFGRKTSR